MLKSRLLGAVGIVVIVSGITGATRVLAQSPSPITEPRFEVASVKPAKPEIGYEIQWGRNTWSSAGPVPLQVLLGLAFGASHYVGLPDWIRTEYFAVNAKAEDGVLLSREELRPRLRQLLVERFKLVTHFETTYTDGYSLILAKSGSKLKETTSPSTMTAIGLGRMRAPSVTMDVFAKQLASVVHQPVVNETGLLGNFDITTEYAPEGAVDSALPSIFTALQDQLGLKLQGGRTLPVETLVIDHVERPTED